jgi:hypothetical protein
MGECARRIQDGAALIITVFGQPQGEILKKVQSSRFKDKDHLVTLNLEL